MPDLCPCCYQPLPVHGSFRVSLEENAIIWRGKYVKLTRHEAEMMYVLAETWPNWANTDRIMYRVYGASSDYPNGNGISVVMARLRRKIREAGIPLTIENSWYRGAGGHQYRMKWED